MTVRQTDKQVPPEFAEIYCTLGRFGNIDIQCLYTQHTVFGHPDKRLLLVKILTFYHREGWKQQTDILYTRSNKKAQGTRKTFSARQHKIDKTSLWMVNHKVGEPNHLP